MRGSWSPPATPIRRRSSARSQGGASPNARNRLGETALLIALKKDDVAMARTMSQAGTDVNIAALNGVTPLMAAAYAGRRRSSSAARARARISTLSIASKRTR